VFGQDDCGPAVGESVLGRRLAFEFFAGVAKRAEHRDGGQPLDDLQRSAYGEDDHEQPAGAGHDESDDRPVVELSWLFV